MNDAAPDDEFQEKVPLTSGQRELWLACQTSLTDYAEVSIRGRFLVGNAVSPEILREAIRLAFRYTPLLGAALRLDVDEPHFVMGAAAEDIDLRFLDVRNDPDADATLKRFYDAFMEEPVETRSLRYALIRTGAEQSLFLAKCSHLYLDGLGYFFHIGFLLDLYGALARGETPTAPEPPSARQLYEAEEAHRQSQRFVKDIAFWKEHLERLPERRIFRARPGCPDVLGCSRHKKYVLSETASRGIDELIKRQNASIATVFTALHALAVSFMCDEKDIVIQTPIAFGERKARSKRQGTYIALPSVLLELRRHATFGELLADVALQSANFFRHVRTPFQAAMRQLPHKNFAHIGDTFINYLPGRPLGPEEFRIIDIDQNHSEKEPVLLGALVMEECLTQQYAMIVRSSRNHLSERDVERYVKRLELLIRQLAAGTELPELDYLLDEEKEELGRWEPGEARSYAVASMPALFDEKVLAFAQREAVRDEHGTRLTYGELRENSLRCASWLAARGVGKGGVVAVLARRTLHLPEIVLGIQRLGAVYLPVDPKAPAERIAYILADSGAALTLDSGAPAHADASLAELPQGPAPEDAAYLIYTSGSTGKPKGVLAPHGGFVNMIQGQIEVFGMGPEDRVLQFAPPIFDASLSEMFMALFAGACLCPVSDESRNAPWSLRQYMTENGVTAVTFPPSYLRLFEREPFPTLRVLITAGEAPVAADALHYAGALRYFNAYGPTETCVCASIKRVSAEETLPISSGRPIPNAVARIADQAGRPRPAGMVGELWIGGASVALGYHGNAALSRQRFRPLPGMDGLKGYATGDLALWSASGELILVGRADDQVKIRGNRVELGEVTHLLENCEGVRQAAVLAMKDASGQPMLAAFLLLRPETTLEAMAAWSRTNLPTYMIPSSWHVLASMPVTRTGKIDREELLRIAQKPAQAKDQERALDPRLREACERALGGPCDPSANFFEQGGDSLKAMSLLHEIRKTYAVDMAFRHFVACQNLHDVEALLGKSPQKAAPRRLSTAPLSRTQYRVWAYQQANGDTIDYNMPLLLEVRGEAAERFVAALRRAMGDQELFCCTIGGDIDAPHFVRREDAAIPLTTVEFADADAAMAHFDELIHTPFDLRKEPPVRLAVAKLADRMQVLVLAHHIAGDGETLQLVLKNALEYLDGRQPDKGSLATQAEFCRREEDYLRSESYRADARYWRDVFSPPVPSVNPATARKGAMASAPVPPEVVARLDQVARQSGATALACFAALLARFLCRKLGRRELLLGVPVGLRETREEFRTAGFYVNTVALRLKAEEDAAAAAGAAAGRLREAIAHSRYCDAPAVPDFLATHARTESLCQGGLSLHSLAPTLRASKFTGSFTLETGAEPRITLEHDAGFIPDGAAFLEELLHDLAEGPADCAEDSALAAPAHAGFAGPRSPRQVLADAWAEILRVEAGEHDDFFRAGGDSIKAIQITGILHRNGITALSAPDFLRTPGFADLCALMERDDMVRPGGGAAYAPVIAGQAVPLLPVQSALLRNHPAHWKIFHMILPLQLGSAVPVTAVEAWLKALPRRFQALGLAFSPAGAVMLEQRQEPTLARLSFPADMPRADVLRAMARDLAPKVDPESGRTMVAGLATIGTERILAVVGHHLTLDVLSLDILHGDLARFLRGEPSGEDCGLATRAVETQRLVDAGEFPTRAQELLWESVCGAPAARLSVPPAAFTGAKAAQSALATMRVRVQGFRADLSSSVFTDLLSALAVALRGAGQCEPILLTLKSHGRDTLLPGMDMSRSLGWFTAECPMPLAPAATCAEADEPVRAFVRDAFTPLACNAFGYLRERDPERFALRSQIGFNYFGAFGEKTGGDVLAQLSLAAPGDIPEMVHPDFEPDCPLDLTSWFDEAGDLWLLAYHDPRVLPAPWVSGLLEGWAGALRTLPAYRPPLAEDVLAAIRAACQCPAEAIERVELPGPCHEPMLYQHLAADNGVYTQQIEFEFSGDIDEFLLVKAWNDVAARHESLRSLFPMPYNGEFYRVVLRQGRTSTQYHDLSHLPQDAARAEAAALLLAQRGKGFDLDRGPLLRAQFFRIDSGTVVLSWCFHHLLMDGWCIGILLQELSARFNALSGRPARPLPAPFPLAEYERWRSRFDEPAAKAYWASLLEGFATMTGVAKTPATPGGTDPETLTLTLDAGLSDRLAAAATSHAVTLSVLLQTLWAFVLGAENGGQRDVVFGIVASGRPAELTGMDRAVGLFIQTLPLRARWTEASSLGELLADVKEQSLQQMRHGYLPLAVIGRNLLDHLMVFENYPFEMPFGDGGPRLQSVRGHEKIPYPLGITVIPGEKLQLRFLYDPAALDSARVAGLQDRLLAAMRAATQDGQVSCREVEAAAAGPGAPAVSAPLAPARQDRNEPPAQAEPRMPADSESAVVDVVREIYAAVLGYPDPSPDADFFLLGGHSLSVMSVMAQVGKRLSVKLGIDDVLANPSPRKLAARIRSASAPAVRIPRVPQEGEHKLSASQQRIWFLQRLHQDSTVYQIPFAARLGAPVDKGALQQALLLLETRHDALRLRVSAQKPVQRLVPPGGLKLECHDGPCTELELRPAPMAFGFDNPLVRVALFNEPDNGPVLLFSAHHIVFDGWSAEIFVRELNQAYDAVLRKAAPAWPALDLDYLSYAAWERQQEPAGIDALKDALLPLPERLRLPLDFPRPAMQSFSGGVEVFRLERGQGERLKDYARGAGVTLFPVLVALVSAFLHRHTGQEDMLLGCPAANRGLDQTGNMIGLFVNTLVLRTPVQPDRNFAELVRTADAALRRALAASCPFEKIIDALGVERDPSRNPLFDVFVALEDAAWTNYDQPPLRMRAIALPHDRSKFDLSFYFREVAPDVFEVHLEYCAELFRKETVRDMCGRLSTLVEAVLARDGAPLSGLDILPERELARLRSFNDTAAPFDLERDADGWFLAQARKTPGHAAILEPSGRSCTYAAFDAMVSALAEHLAAGGLARGDYAAVCFERSLDMMACVFAVMRLGAIYVPLAASLPEERRRSIFEDLGRCTVICAPESAALFSGCGQRVLAPDLRNLPQAQGPCAKGKGGIAPDDVAYVIFTSGSTGRPKGVQIEQRSLCNRLLWMQSQFPIGADDVLLQKTTVTFDVSIWELFWWSWCGASLALLEPEGEKNPARIIETVHARRVTVVHFVPSMLRVFLDHLEARPEDVRKLSSLRYVFTSGEALPRELVSRFNALLRAELHNLYGPTEATVDVSWQPCLETPSHAVPIGRPVANTGLHVLDARQGQAPIGVAGEIWISGVQVARGYLNRPELTAQNFVPDPATPGGRMYRTGDLGRWLPDGSIEYLGRNDDQVKVRGYRIELGEVEAALGRCHGVAQAVVRACRIGGHDALEAFLLPRDGAALSVRSIRAALAVLLPDYMLPALFHTVEEIPLSPSGKADRKRLKGVPLAPDEPAEPGAADAAGGKAAQSALQDAVRALWQRVMPEMDVRAADLGFFEAGGNSLLLVQLHALLEERWPGVFSLASLFSESTIRAQARFIAQARGLSQPHAAVAAPNAPVAVIGMAVRVGDYEDTERFWEDLALGADKNVPLPEKRRREVRQIFEAVGYAYDESRLREASYLSDISSFDHKRFGLAPGDAALLDPRQRVFLETALLALDDAGYGGAALKDKNVGTFVGASPYRLFQDAATRAFPEQSEQIYLLNVPSNVVARLSYLKNWSGPASTVDTACSSVLTAVHEACASLRLGESCVALAGGAHTIDLPLKADRTFTIEAASGRTRTFDAGADGVGAGEGAAVFVLKLLDQALRDHDPIHAVIAGSAVNQDGRSSSMAAPNPQAQAGVITLAARNAGVSLADISFFEAHGTATVLGDPVEIEGLSRAFAKEGAQVLRKAPIGSVKGNLGHLDAAAGAVGLAKAVLCLEKGFVPPQPHFEQPNPHIDFAAAPVRVPRTLEPLPEAARLWRCGVSSFGLSGVNAHVVLAEQPQAALPPDDGSWFCVPLSAPDEAGLRGYRQRLREAVRRNGTWPLHAIAATLAAGREHLEVRTAIVAQSRQQLLDALAGDCVACACADRQGRTDRDSAGASAVCASRAEAEAAAEGFLSGRTLHWPDGRPLHRLHLPATPFSRVPLWPRFAAQYVAGPTQTPTGEVYQVAIDRPDFWPVAEHRLNGVPTLVGMAMLDLIGKTAGPLPLRIEKLRWRRPVTLATGSRAILLVQERDGARSLELHHLQDGAWNVAASATVRPDAPQPPQALDLAALRQGLHPFEAQGGPQVVSVSERWQCREGLWIADGGDRLLAQIALPDAFRHDLHSFRWHPAMADVAASLALHGADGFVPASCGEVRLHRPLPARILAHVTVTHRLQDMISARCVIADLSGNVLVEMDDLTFLALRQARPNSAEQAAKPSPVLYALEWAPADLQHAPPAQNGGIMLLGRGGTGPGEALAARASLRRELPPLPEQRQALAQEILRSDIRHIVHLPAPEDSAWAFPSLLQELCRARLRHPLRITAVGHGALRGDAPTPEHALLLGPLLCLPQEEPLISCAYAELASQGPKVMRAFMESLGRIDGPYAIDVDGSVRVRQLAALPAPATAATTIQPDGCVVITGGLGGMGLTLARQIAAATGVRVALLHRRAASPPDIPFACYRCDVADAAQVARTLAVIRREIGPIQGVIHAAGVEGDGYLLTKSRESYEAVLAPKVAGTWNLHEATRDDALRFFVLASSRTSLTGAPGQCDYTAANAFLNAFAQHRRGLGLPAAALCWNTWSGVGMAARRQADKGGFTLAPEQAIGVLAATLASGSELAVVAMSGEDLAPRRPTAPYAPPAPNGPRQQTPGQSIEAELLEIFRDCLGYETTLTREDDFFELGGDSIAGTRIVSRIDQALGVKASVMDLLESDTLGGFMDRVLADREKDAPARPDLEPAPVRDKYPVGREQLSILYADMLGEGHLGFNLPAFLRLPRDLDKGRLEEAIGVLVQRHEVLRTTFCDFDAPHPNMVIHPFAGFRLAESRIADLSHKESFITPFDLKREAGFRVRLLVTDAGENILFYDVHHALADGRTISLLNAELYRLYHGLPLDPVGAQQKDFAWRQFTRPNAEDREYWLALFKGDLPKLDLPSDHVRPLAHTSRGGMHEFALPAQLVAGMKRLARREGVTNYHIALTAWSLLAHAYTGQDDLVIAITVDGRDEHLNTAGMLASLLPLRLEAKRGTPLRALLKDTQKASNEALRHRGYILNNLLADLQPPACLDRSPLSEVILSYMNFEFASGEPLLFEPLHFDKHASKTDLSIFASDTGEGISFALEYYADLFSHADVVRMAEDFTRILELMTTGDAEEPVPFTYSPPARRDVGSVRRELGVGLAEDIRRVAARKGVSPASVLLATFAALFSRVTSRQRFAVDVVPAGPVRFAVTDDTEFDDLLRQTSERLEQAEHGAQAGPEAQAEDASTGGPLLRAAFSFADAASPSAEVRLDAAHDLACRVEHHGSGMSVRLDHDTRALSADAAGNWLGYYGTFLSGIAKGND
ncbi:amino acid adenylation domain-containing protein [Humidesulfovibrio idahonensis]